MSRANPSGSVLHTHVALLECDSPITLDETLLFLAALPVHTMRVGDCSVAFPAHEFSIVQKALMARQLFPTVVGPQPDMPIDPTEDL